MTQLMLGSALQPVAGPLADLFQKLSGPDGATKWLPGFKRFLRGENPWDGKPLFQIWRTITVGQRRGVEDLIEALRREDVDVAQDILTVLGRSGFSGVRQEIDLVKLTFGEIGFPEGAHYPVAKRRLQSLGLELCTMEMVAEARLAYLDQEDEEEFIEFAIPPIELADGTRLLPDLRIDDDSGRLKICACGEGDNFPGPEVELICVLPRK